MKKMKEYHICDRCKKVIKGKEINEVYYYAYSYELCNDCLKLHNEFERKVKDIKKEWENLEKEYKFGKYLPKEDEQC